LFLPEIWLGLVSAAGFGRITCNAESGCVLDQSFGEKLAEVLIKSEVRIAKPRARTADKKLSRRMRTIRRFCLPPGFINIVDKYGVII
jgi:hypothetical protein